MTMHISLRPRSLRYTSYQGTQFFGGLFSCSLLFKMDGLKVLQSKCTKERFIVLPYHPVSASSCFVTT